MKDFSLFVREIPPMKLTFTGFYYAIILVLYPCSRSYVCGYCSFCICAILFTYQNSLIDYPTHPFGAYYGR